MSEATTRLLGVALLLVHLGLGLWAVLGLSEAFLSSPPWPRLSDPLFPAWLQQSQWLTSLAGAGVLVVGYVTRWRHTPVALAAAYATMATVCAIETLGFLVHETRFRAMVLEYATYAMILALLFHPGLLGARFRPRSRSAQVSTRP